MNIQICIITGQPLANLIPLLQYKPDHIILLQSKGMKDRGNGMISVLELAGWRTEQIELDDKLPDTSYEQILDFALEFAEELRRRYPESVFTYNATGGNKLMSMALSSVFDQEKDRVIYADTKHQHIEYLHPSSAKIEPMQSCLTIELYLKAMGKTLRSRQDTNTTWLERANARKDASRYLGENTQDLQGLISQFNRHFAEFNNSEDAPSTFRLATQPHTSWKTALKKLTATGVLADNGNNSWLPSHIDCAKYLSGGWLEEYTWHCARDSLPLNAQKENAAISAQVTDDSKPNADIRNEADVILLANNKLLLIECKTGDLQHQNKDQDAINKLDALTNHAGGTMGKGLLVSVKPLNHQTKQKRHVNSADRARSQELLVCEGNDLRLLRKHLKQWAESSHWPD